MSAKRANMSANVSANRTIARGARLGRSVTAPVSVSLLAAVLCAAAGCLDDQLDPAQGEATAGSFIALQRDFQSFLGWTRVQVGDAAIVGGHAAGPRFVYVHGTPSDGAFTVGTMIVKTVEVGDPTTWTIHARAKRGGGFNAQGAIGWEWFDLRIVTTNDVTIIWRGDKPPADHGYESLPGLGATSTMDGDCNSCHALARDTDFILDAPLKAELAP